MDRLGVKGVGIVPYQEYGENNHSPLYHVHWCPESCFYSALTLEILTLEFIHNKIWVKCLTEDIRQIGGEGGVGVLLCVRSLLLRKV